MSPSTLRKKLERAVGVGEPVVEILVPQDAAEDIVKGSEAVTSAVQKLFNDKAELTKIVEYERRERFVLQNRLHMVENEREFDRAQVRNLTHANGQLTAIINSMIQGINGMSQVIHQSQIAAEQIPLPPSVSGEPRENGGAPMPTLQEIAERCAPVK